MFLLLHTTPLSVDLEFINPTKLTEETHEVVQMFLLNEYGTVHLNILSKNLIFASGLKLIEKIGEGKQKKYQNFTNCIELN